VIQLRIQRQGGSLLKETTAKYYKQWSAELELLVVCYSGARARLKGVQVAKRLRWQIGAESQV